ncbi:hypothetical protein BCV70DRAFT_51328 [Testicularia cyperi]|uniref:Uncharacterized protein n=1 Tax=Testicularia cyperi TaxID=1882483 RepID=A0A317XV60_9BASI|nr:hypothetical protein BCV70DRAFT_51328 [Testicularia cyperi]
MLRHEPCSWLGSALPSFFVNTARTSMCREHSTEMHRCVTSPTTCVLSSLLSPLSSLLSLSPLLALSLPFRLYHQYSQSEVEA